MKRAIRWKAWTVVVVVLLAVGGAVAQDSKTVQHVNPDTLHTPRGYSHVVIVRGGTTVYIAGQVPLDKKGNIVGAGDFGAQVRQVFENLKSALDAAGVTFNDVVSVNAYVTDVSKIDVYRKVRDEYMKGELPTSTFVEVKGLFRPDVMVEVSAIAVKK